MDVIIIGEVHDNPLHHANQAQAVSELAPSALVFEQVTPVQAAVLTPDVLEDEAALEAALEWEARGWPDFSMYYPIFAAAPEAAIFGGGLPREAVRRAMGEGAATVFGDGASLFGIDRALQPDVQASQEALQQSAHCDALPADILPGMVEAQRLRDAGIARAVVAAHHEAQGRDGPVVVITGNGHARSDWGVPSLLAYLPEPLKVVSIGQYEEAAPENPPFDAWIVTEAVERADPCEAFR